MAQRWMILDGFNHEFPYTPDAGLHLWVEVVGDVGDVDGQLMTRGVVAVADDDWYNYAKGKASIMNDGDDPAVLSFTISLPPPATVLAPKR